MEWYRLTQKEIEKELKLSSKEGLSLEQVEKNRQEFGENELQSQNKKSIWLIFIIQFQDFLVMILLAATLIAGLLGEYIDAIAIMLIVVLNGCIGFFQEHRAEKSLEKLKELSAPHMRVLRQGKWLTLPAKEAVVGDVVQITAGDRVPADIRIVQANHLETEESMLTGESIPVTKCEQALQEVNLSIQEQKNMAFKSTLVTKGNGIGIVVQTGMDTEVGKIASLMDETEEVATPLEVKLKELGKILIYVVFLLTALTVAIGIYHGQLMYDMFLAGVSLAVAVIPEGLPAIVTVALSLGVQRMIKRKAIVRKLSAIETLGSTSVICTDKTGTITENKMTVKQLYIGQTSIEVTGEGDTARGRFKSHIGKTITNEESVSKMLLAGTLCNSASLRVKKGKYTIEGDPTDGALLVAARKLNITYKESDQFIKLQELPFDSTRKRMTVVVQNKNQERYLIVKGAPEVIFPRSKNMYQFDGSTTRIDREGLQRNMKQMAKDALRMIAISVRKLSPEEELSEKTISMLEKDLTLIGLYGLQDPPRKNVKRAIQQCKEAGIKTVMITGDHQATAKAIGKQVGLYEAGDLIIDGDKLNQMSMAELTQIIERVTIFARVTPAHKLKIVQAFQQKNHIVAMTGDGVNDAPAVKASNVGISMGKSGTDVTKEASALILLDDNFQTIKEAIREGRNIYENIRKFIRYLLASNVGEIFIMLVAMLLALPLPLVPVQILWVNLITDGLPAMALGLDPPETNVMKQKPRNPKEGIFSRGLGKKIISRGLLIGLVSLISFVIVYRAFPEDLNYARSVAFTTLVLAQLIHVFDCRSDRGLFARNIFSNIYLLLAVLSSFMLLLIVIYVEALQPIFHTTALSFFDWLFIFSLSALPTVLFSFPSKKLNP